MLIFFWVWCNFQFQKDVGKTQSFETFQKRKLDENVYQVERVLNVRKQKGKLECEIKWMGYEETTWEPKTNLQGEACEFLLDSIFSVLSSYILISLLFQCKRKSIWKLVSQKEEFVTLSLIDMIKLTIIPKFQNLIRKQKKQKMFPR